MPDTLTARDRYHLKKYGSVDSPVRLVMKNGGSIVEHRDVLLKQFGNGVKDITANTLSPLQPQQPSQKFSFIPEKYNIINSVENEVSPKEFTEKYIQSDIYKNRLIKSGYNNVDIEVKNRLSDVKKTNTTYQKKTPSITTQIYNEINSIPYTLTGSNASSNGNVIIDLQQAKKLNVPAKSIETHEYSHKETGIDFDRLNNYDIIELQGRLKEGIKNPHDIDPTENKADMNVIRYELYNNGVDVINKPIEKKHLDIIRKMKSSGGKRFLEHYRDEDALWLLNNIAQNNQPQLINSLNSQIPIT